MRKTDHWIDAYLEYTDNTEPPELYREWVAVSTVAAALERKVWRGWGPGETWYPNFYVVLVGPSGKARKSTAMGPGKDLLRTLEDVNLGSESTTPEALVEQLREAERISIDEEDTNYLHSSLTVFSKEFTVFLGYSNLQFMADLTDLYDCEDQWKHKTKTQGESVIEGVWLNLIGATTPDSLTSSLPDDAVGGGFTSRIIFVYQEEKGRTVYTPWETEDQKELFEDLSHDLQNIHKMMGEFNFTEAALERYITWREHIEDNPPVEHHAFGGYNSRRVHHTVCLSMIMSAARNNDLIIMEEDFDRADNLLKRTEMMMPRVFGGVGYSSKSKVTERICRFIAQQKATTEADLLRRFISDVDGPEDMREILWALDKTGFITRKDQGGEMKIKFNTDYENADRWLNGRADQ